MEIVSEIIRNRLLGSKIELHNSYEPVVGYINQRTPTAYGAVAFVDSGQECDLDIDRTEAKSAVLALISEIQSSSNYSVRLEATLEDYINDGEVHVRTLHGGSAGQILLLQDTETDKLFIRKVAARYGVEGNGSPKLLAEINFLRAIQKRPECQELLKLYPKITDHGETELYIFLDQEYIGEGFNVFTMLSRNRISAADHAHYVDQLLDSLIPNGYALHSSLVPRQESLEQLEDYYLRRAEGRIRFLKNCDEFKLDFPAPSTTTLPNLIERPEYTINGRSYKNPVEIIRRIRGDARLSDLFRPRTQSFCVHGDMTFLNMVYDNKNESYRLIDNRGHIGNWDALYDFGKLKFTISGFGQVMLKDFELQEDKDGSFELTLTGNEDGKATLSQIDCDFFGNLSKNAQFNTLTKNEPHWQDRVLFAEAIHYLADIPHRLLLDQSPKHAVAVYLLGLKCLNDLYEKVAA